MNVRPGRDPGVSPAVAFGSLSTSLGWFRGGTMVWLVVMLLASVGVLWSLWSVPYLPTHDGPQHIMFGHIENHFDDPNVIYPALLRPSTQLASRGFAALFVPLEARLPWRDALRVTLSIALLGWAWGGAVLVAAVDPRRRLVGVSAFAMAFQWPLYMGFFPFVIGSAFGLFILALAVRVRVWSVRHRVVLTLMLLTQSFLHVFSALLTGMVLFVLVWHRAPRGRRRGEVLRLLGMLLPALLVFVSSLRVWSGLARVHSTPLTWLSLREYVPVVLRCAVPGPWWRGVMVVGLVAVGLAGAVRRWRAGVASVEDRVLLSSSAVFLSLGVLAPFHLPGWQFFSPRFFPLGLLLGASLIDPSEWRSRAKVWLAQSAVVFVAFVSLVWAAVWHRTLYEGSAEALSGLDGSIRRTGLRLPVIVLPYDGLPRDPVRSPVPYMQPLRNLGALYVTVQGGLIPYLFAGSGAVHNFELRQEGWALAPPVPEWTYGHELGRPEIYGNVPLRYAVMTMYAAHGARYEDVILVGESRDVDLFLRRGYVADWRRGSLLLARFRGCRATLGIRTSRSVRASVEYGWFPLADAHWERSVNVSAASATVVPLEGSPCGDVWIRVKQETPTGKTFQCRGADREGRIMVRMAQGTPNEVTCVLEETS